MKSPIPSPEEKSGNCVTQAIGSFSFIDAAANAAGKRLGISARPSAAMCGLECPLSGLERTKIGGKSR